METRPMYFPPVSCPSFLKFAYAKCGFHEEFVLVVSHQKIKKLPYCMNFYFMCILIFLNSIFV